MTENQGVKLVPFRRETKLTRYLALPKELLKLDLSTTAMVVYALLLDRANLSQANGWTDETGRVYVIFSVESLGMYLGREKRSIQRVLKELEKHNLITRLRRGNMEPNHIFLRIPAGSVDNPVESIPSHSA
jgi:DNA-binding MarR family transcriptional regulator